MSEEGMFDKPDPTIRRLDIGEGIVRIACGNGYTYEAAPGVYVKPHFYIEVNVPNGAIVEEYIKQVNDLVDRVLESQETRALRLAGVLPPRETEGHG
jgi:hypothetical protein